MKNLTIVVIIAVCALQTAVSLGQECRHDTDCNYLEYCFKTNFCAKCENCSKFYRQNGSDICSRTPQQCGACLEGYMENIEHDRYDGERATYCIIATKILISNVPPGANENSDKAEGNEKYDWTILIIVIASVSAILMIITAAYLFFTRYWPKEYTARIMRSFGIISETNAPRNAESVPLSTPSAPPYTHDIPVKENPPSYSQVQFENENRHNAVMERRPNYVSETDIPDDNLDNPENNEENNNNGNNAVLVVDENTQPSNWTPEPRNENTPPARTTFTDCLSTPSQESQEPRSEHQSTRRPADPEPRRSKRQRVSRADVNVNVNTQHISQQSSQNNIINVINLGRMPHHFTQATGGGSTHSDDFTHVNTTHVTMPIIRSGANRGAQESTIIQSQTEQSSSSFNRNLDHPSSSQDCVPYSNNESRNISSPTASIRHNLSDDDELND